MVVKKLVLTIELVPNSAWGNNLRNKIPISQWNVIRKKCYSDYGNRCAICKSLPEQSLHCHEIWQYDGEHHIQQLKGFIALCEDCHNIKHFGRAKKVLSPEKLALLTDHFMRVNEVDFDALKEHDRETISVWKERSKHDWSLDLGDFDPARKENA